MSDIETHESNHQVIGLRWRTAEDGSRVLQQRVRFNEGKYNRGLFHAQQIGRQEWRDVLDKDVLPVPIPPPPPPLSEAPPLQREIFVVETPKGTPLWSTARGGATETIRSYNHMRGRDPNGPLPGGYQVARYQTVREETI